MGVIAAEVIQINKLPTPLVWIEHRSEESTNGGEQAFVLVVFSSYEVTERAPPWEDEGMDRGGHLEVAGSHYCGGIGGWEVVIADRGKRIQFASWNFSYCGVERTLCRAHYLNRRGILRTVL